MLLTTAYNPAGNRLITVPLFLAVLTGAGVLYGYLRDMSGSLWPVIIAHGTFNAVLGILADAAVTSDPRPPPTSPARPASSPSPPSEPPLPSWRPGFGATTRCKPTVLGSTLQPPEPTSHETARGIYPAQQPAWPDLIAETGSHLPGGRTGRGPGLGAARGAWPEPAHRLGRGRFVSARLGLVDQLEAGR